MMKGWRLGSSSCRNSKYMSLKKLCGGTTTDSRILVDKYFADESPNSYKKALIKAPSEFYPLTGFANFF